MSKRDARLRQGCEVCGEQTALACGKTLQGRECRTPLCADCECPSEERHVSEQERMEAENEAAAGATVQSHIPGR